MTRPCHLAMALTLATLLLAACSGREASNGAEAETEADTPATAEVPAPVNAPVAELPSGTPAVTAANTASPAQQPAAPTPALAVEGEGLRLFDRATGRARPIPFGTARAEVERALSFRAPPRTGIQSECGAGPLTYAAWSDGLKLYYREGRFVGWALDRRAASPRGPAIGTAASIGPGITRTQLSDAVVATFEKTSLGTEFRTGSISGVLDGTGTESKITDMWAGANCVFR